MGDPLEPLFGQPTAQLYRAKKVEVAHGSPSRLPEWMTTGVLASIEQLCKDFSGPLQIAQGRTFSEDKAGPTNFVGAGGQTPVSGANATALLRLGLSVHFGDIERTVPAASPFLRAIESALSLSPCMRLSAFANAPGSGLPLHHDSYDQLLIHLIGEKVISYRERRDVDSPRISYSPSGPVPKQFEAVYRRGFSDRRSLDEAELVTVTLEPGSCLFLPAGTWHRTEGQSEPCLSLTTALRAPSGLDLLMTALRAHLSQSENWRSPVYGALTGEPDGSEEARIDELLRALPGELSKLDFRALRQAYYIAGIEPGVVDAYPTGERFNDFIRLPSTVCELLADPDDPNLVRCRVRVFTMSTFSELQMDAEARPVVEWILDQTRSFSLQELAAAHDEFDEEDLATIAVQLAQVGLLRPTSSSSYG